MKCCRGCGLEKDTAEFSLNRHGKPRNYCKRCRAESARHKYDPHYRMRADALRRYGITPERYDELLEAQNGVCAICGGAERNRRMTRLCVDHDHSTGEVRGLLCDACNRAIGLLREDVAAIESAAAYLRR